MVSFGLSLVSFWLGVIVGVLGGFLMGASYVHYKKRELRPLFKDPSRRPLEGPRKPEDTSG